MLKIRLYRIGKKKQASFRVVVLPHQSKPKGGEFTEDLGWYNAHTNKYEFKTERVKYWMEHGAKPSDTVAGLLKKAGITA